MAEASPPAQFAHDKTEEPPGAFPTPEKMEERELIQILQGYKSEAQASREEGTEPRQQVWEDNLDAFWMRRDDYESDDTKSDWQAKERAPYISNYVERLQSGLRKALTQNPDWGEVSDPKDKDGATTALATRFTRLLLDKSGTNATGQPTKFESTFGNTVRSGALMAMCASVTWRDGRLRIELVDPQSFFPDPTGRGLYRVRPYEKDRNQLLAMADEVDAEGNEIWDKKAIQDELELQDRELEEKRARSSGEGTELSSVRKPMLIDEYLCTVLNQEGEAVGTGADEEPDRGVVSAEAKKELIVVLNERVVIRREPNPFWHGQDWIVFHPLLKSPLGEVDGRTYVEEFRHQAHTLENFTNMIIDAVRMNSMNAFEVNPELLQDPEQLVDGVYPGMAIMRGGEDDDTRPILGTVELGRHLGPEAFNTWRALKQEMQEAGAQSDLSLGNTVTGETTAREIDASSAGQSALTGSIAADIEDEFLAVILLLAYYTGIQHLTPESHPQIVNGLSPEEIHALMAQRDEYSRRPMEFKANGITSMLERAQRLRASMGALNVVGGNPLLLQAFRDEGYSIGKFLNQILQDMGVDLPRIKMTPAEQQKAQAESNLRKIQAAQGGDPGNPGGPGPTGGAPSGLPTAQNQGGVDPGAQTEGIDGGIP